MRAIVLAFPVLGAQMHKLVVGMCAGAVMSCGGVRSDVHSEEEELVAKSVSQLAASIVAEDTETFERLLSPTLLAQLPTSPADRQVALAEALRVQKQGWLRSLGDRASNPEIAELSAGVGGEFAVRLKLQTGRDEKQLWFAVGADGARFIGPHPDKSGVAARGIAGALESWNWRWQNNTPFIPNSGSWEPYSCPLGYGSFPHPAYSNLWKAVGCQPAGLGSCRAAVVSTYNEFSDCKNSCMYQWIGADVWWNNGGNPVMNCGQ